MKNVKSNQMHLVWHLLETFKPDALEQHMLPDRGEIHFHKNGVFMTFWIEEINGEEECQATIVYKGENTFIRGTYDKIIKKLEELLCNLGKYEEDNV